MELLNTIRYYFFIQSAQIGKFQSDFIFSFNIFLLFLLFRRGNKMMNALRTIIAIVKNDLST